MQAVAAAAPGASRGGAIAGSTVIACPGSHSHARWSASAHRAAVSQSATVTYAMRKSLLRFLLLGMSMCSTGPNALNTSRSYQRVAARRLSMPTNMRTPSAGARGSHDACASAPMEHGAVQSVQLLAGRACGRKHSAQQHAVPVEQGYGL